MSTRNRPSEPSGHRFSKIDENGRPSKSRFQDRLALAVAVLTFLAGTLNVSTALLDLRTATESHQNLDADRIPVQGAAGHGKPYRPSSGKGHVRSKTKHIGKRGRTDADRMKDALIRPSADYGDRQ